jgi:hypothetical protein
MPAAKKLDLYKEHKAEYVAPKKPVLVKVKPAKYLTITGKGKPGGELFQKHLGALFGVAFTIKMARKFAGQEYKVCHLEGLWWGDKEGLDFSAVPLDQYNWKLIIRVPDFIQKKDLDSAVRALKEKGKGPQVAEVKLEKINEGLCVQMLHVGPYPDEVTTIAQMMELAAQNGLTCRGPHHEIYLSDPRRVPPVRLRTILRFSVRPSAQSKAD